MCSIVSEMGLGMNERIKEKQLLEDLNHMTTWLGCRRTGPLSVQ